MDKLFSSLKTFVKKQSVVIDGPIFRLHYRITVAILIGCSLLVTAKQYFGDPIDCISKDDVPRNLLDTFCWIHTTFSVEDAWFKKVGVEVPYPGVDKYTPGETRVYHAYYQWVCFMLFIQALFFYLPRYLWKNIEGGKTKNLLLGLDSPILEEGKKDKNRAILVEYLHRNMNNHNGTYYVFMFSEVLNLVNVIFQLILMNSFLGGEFTTYGWKVLQFSEWDWSVRYDPMIRVFPRLTKCTFHRFGSSGDVQKYDAMCILPINIINEKIYVFLWFWFYFVAIVTFLALILKISFILRPTMRIMVLRSRCRMISTEALTTVINKCPIGDWFVLDLLSRNLDSLNFRDLIVDLYIKLEGGKAAAYLNH